MSLSRNSENIVGPPWTAETFSVAGWQATPVKYSK